MQSVLQCHECGCDEVVVNPREGRVECKACGLVLDSAMLDERSEWRDFSEKDKDQNHDPSRVGKKLNFTKSNGGVGTYLSGGKGMKMLAQTMNRAKAGGSSGHDARMKQAEGELRRWCELCNAPDIVLKGSLTIMAEILRNCPQHIRGKKNTAVHAAVLRWSSYLHNSVITLKQVSALAGLEVKVFNKAYKAVEAALQDLAKADASWRELLVSARSPVKANVTSYLRNMGIVSSSHWKFVQACQEAADRARPKDADGAGAKTHRPWDAKQPTTIAGAIIYMMSLLPKAPQTFTTKHVSSVTGQAESTLVAAYADLYPYARELIPDTWSTDADIATLPDPNKR